VSIIAELVKGGLSGIISPITATITAIATKKADTKVEEGKQDVAVIQSRNALLGAIHRDPAVATGFYLFILPSGLHFSSVVLFCLVKPWVPWWKVVLAIPDHMQYIPYAVVAFLFGLSWRGKT
jgi:hypothetical protein